MQILLIYSLLGVLSFVNIIAPMPGSSVVTPLLATLVDPHRAIGLVGLYFVVSGISRIFLFRQSIQKVYLNELLWPSIIGAAVGAWWLVAIPSKILLAIIFVALIYFFIQKLKSYGRQKDKEKNEASDHKMTTGGRLIGLFTGFLQGSGLSGSDLRAGYLYAKGLDISMIHGTAGLVGTVNFFIASLVRFETNQVSLADIKLIASLFPVLFLAQWLGRQSLRKLNKKWTDLLIVLIMIGSIVGIGLKLIK